MSTPFEKLKLAMEKKPEKGAPKKTKEDTQILTQEKEWKRLMEKAEKERKATLARK